MPKLSLLLDLEMVAAVRRLAHVAIGTLRDAGLGA